MSQTQILVLGAIAGLTIFIGLPVGRMGRLPIAASAFLAATATGILLFLLWDVLAGRGRAGRVGADGRRGRPHRRLGTFAWLAALLGGGFVVGLMSLVYFDELIARRRRSRRARTASAPPSRSRRRRRAPGWRACSRRPSRSR